MEWKNQFDKLLVAAMILIFLPCAIWLEIKFPESTAARWAEGLMLTWSGALVTLLNRQQQKPPDPPPIQLQGQYTFQLVPPKEEWRMPEEVDVPRPPRPQSRAGSAEVKRFP